MVGPVVQLQVHGLDWAASSPRAVSAAAVLVRLVRGVAGRPTTWNQKWRQNIYFFVFTIHNSFWGLDDTARAIMIEELFIAFFVVFEIHNMSEG